MAKLKKAKNDERQLIEIARHRNGVGGAPFYVVLFDWKEDGDKLRHMVATVFPTEGACAVLDTTETAAGNIAFAGGNSWRGDHFEEQLRDWIVAWEKLRNDEFAAKVKV